MKFIWPRTYRQKTKEKADHAHRNRKRKLATRGGIGRSTENAVGEDVDLDGRRHRETAHGDGSDRGVNASRDWLGSVGFVSLYVHQWQKEKRAEHKGFE